MKQSSANADLIGGNRNGQDIIDGANQHISSVPTQESIVSFAGHQVAMEQPINMFAPPPLVSMPQPPSVTHQSAAPSSNSVAIRGIDSGE